VEIEEFWRFLERSAQETADPTERLSWLEHRLSRIALAHIVDFQVHFETVRRSVDTWTMWGAANQIMDGLCGTDSFWYFQPWLIGQGQHWWQHAVDNPDNLADLPAVRALAGRDIRDWADPEWPHWPELADVAAHAHDNITGQEDSIDDPLAARGCLRHSDPQPTGQYWDQNSRAEIRERLPRLAQMFPRHRKMKP
jgi:uncharacterized protein DUF4240